jgi:hypothetical protein
MPAMVRADKMRMEHRNIERVSSIIRHQKNPIVRASGPTPVWVYEKLTKYASTLLERQWQLCDNYEVVRTSTVMFSVHYIAGLDSFPSAFVLMQRQYLTCDCLHFTAFAMVCRHVLAVLFS